MKFELSDIGKFSTAIACGDKNRKKFGLFYLDVPADSIRDAQRLENTYVVRAAAHLDSSADTPQKWLAWSNRLDDREVIVCLSENAYQQLNDVLQEKRTRGVEMTIGNFQILAAADVRKADAALVIVDCALDLSRLSSVDLQRPLFPELAVLEPSLPTKSPHLVGINPLALTFY